MKKLSGKFEATTLYADDPICVLRKFNEQNRENPIMFTWDTVRLLIEKPQEMHKHLPETWIYDDADLHQMLSIFMRFREVIYRKRESLKQREQRTKYNKGGL